MTTLTPAYPKQFTFYHPIAVRYADLDPQRHVNNIAVLEYVRNCPDRLLSGSRHLGRRHYGKHGHGGRFGQVRLP